MELRDTPPHTPIPNQNGFAFNRDEGEVSSKRLISKGPQEERKSPGVKRTVVKLILENFQSAFNKKISQSFVDNIQLQPSSLLWRYFLLDYIICNFFIAPAVIAFWRGTWDYSLVWIKGIEYFNVSSHKLFKTFCLQTYLLFLLLLLFHIKGELQIERTFNHQTFWPLFLPLLRFITQFLPNNAFGTLARPHNSLVQ